MQQTTAKFDPLKKESELRAESESWDTSNPESAQPGDIPIINADDYFSNPTEHTRKIVADQLLHACTQSGFYILTGHGISEELIAHMFSSIRSFHALPLQSKLALTMDNPDWPIKGSGYLPFLNKKLPSREKGNANEAFIVKRELGPRNISLADNQWPAESELPGFRKTVVQYADAIEDLSMRLLPIYATALNLPENFFAPGFESPIYRLRMTRYPPIKKYQQNEFGIAPHVDTTFFTILTQDSEGLIIYCEQRHCWIRAPLMDNAFIINTGELLRQWSNDKFLSVKHFANNNYGKNDRYSIPFFFNATADYPMQCLPSCCDENNPAKYPTVSYLQSQGVIQGE